jgi:hypothetical protein
MPKPYSQDLRERVVRHVEAGHSRRTAAAALGRCEGAQTGLDNLGARAREKASDNAQLPFWSKQRPGYVFSGLVRCGVSGGGFSKISAAHLGCSTARNKGVTVCDNRGVDDLSAHREKAGLHQRRLEALKQNFDRRLVIDLRPVRASRKFQIEFASGTLWASDNPRKRMNERRSLMRYSVRSSDSEWLDLRIRTLNISTRS